MTYSQLFEEILANPPLYVGNCNIQRFAFFMNGYIHARWQDGNEDTSDLYFGFQSWVANRYNVSVSLNWAKIITLFSSDEIDAFERTIELWNEYKSEMQKNNREN